MAQFWIDYTASALVEAETEEEALDNFWTYNNIIRERDYTEVDRIERED